jgi:hypothetical protein
MGAQKATMLLMDLLPHPASSSPKAPRMEENIQWAQKANAVASDRQAPSSRTFGVRSPYPVGAATPRIHALVRFGANPTAAGALFRSVCRKSEEECQALFSLKNPPHPGELSSNDGSCLHRAFYAGPTPLAVLLAKKAAPEHWLSRDTNGRYPLGKALMSHNLRRALLAASKAPLSLLAPDNDGNTILHQLLLSFPSAARPTGTDPQWMKFAAQVATSENATAVNSAGLSALAMAVESGLVDFVRLLAPLSDLSALSPAGEPIVTTAMARSSFFGFDCARALLDFGADLNAPNVSGSTPLHLAASRGDLPSVRWLLDHGARADRLDANARTPGALAAERLQWSALDLLAQHTPISTLRHAIQVAGRDRLPLSFSFIERFDLLSTLSVAKNDSNTTDNAIFEPSRRGPKSL